MILDMITVHIREVAEKRRIKNAHQLSLLAKIPANMAVRLWEGEFQRIDRSTLDKLCTALKCQPGQLIKYKGGHDGED
jgi:DNA-binding Xre family transcriptional regulator